MKRAIIGAALFAALAGCSTLTTLATTTVPAKDIIAAANAFDAVELTAANYISYCAPKTQPAGCSSTAIAKLIPAIKAGRTARNNAEAAVKASPNADQSVDLYNAIVTATQTLTDIESQYSIGSTK